MTDAAALVADLQKPWRHGTHVDARGVVLEAPLVLDGMPLCGMDLSGAVLRGGLSARGAVFQGLAWFREVQIEGPCDLSGARFRIDLRAERLTCPSLVLDDAEIRGVLALARARLGGLSLKRALILANVTLEEANVARMDVTDAEIMGGVWADQAGLGAVSAEGCSVFGRTRNWLGATQSS